MNDVPLKQCTKCREFFPPTTEYFPPDKEAKDRLRSSCRICERKRYAQYDDAHREERREQKRSHYHEHIEEEQARVNRYHVEHREQQRLAAREYRKNNPERSRESVHKWQRNNQDKVRRYVNEHREQKRASCRKWYRNNTDTAKTLKARWLSQFPDRQKQATKNWRKNNPAKVRATVLRRVARKRGLPDRFTEADWLTALSYWQGKCAYCGTGKAEDADHFVPLANPDCPGTIPENILPTCEQCNSLKNAHDPTKWLALRFGEDEAQTILERITEYFEAIKRR